MNFCVQQEELFHVYSDFLDELPDLGLTDHEKMRRYDSKMDEWMFRVISLGSIILYNRYMYHTWKKIQLRQQQNFFPLIMGLFLLFYVVF